MTTCDYGHETTGTFSPIRVPLADDDGFPVVDLQTAEVMFSTFRLPDHRARFPGNERDPDTVLPNGENRASRWEADLGGAISSPFDPAGLVMVLCEHGLAEHPDGRERYPRFGLTWVRAKYATTRYLCVIDDGAERPADLTEMRP